MGYLTCSSYNWRGTIEYCHIEEDLYYWERCAFELFSEGEYERIGSFSAVNYMIELCEDILEGIENYADKEKLLIRWRLVLDQQKILNDELKQIKDDLKELIKSNKFKDLLQVQHRVVKLKSKLI